MSYAAAEAEHLSDPALEAPSGEAFATEVDDLIDRLKTLPDFISEAAYGNNLRNDKARSELQAQWRVAMTNFDAQSLFDTEWELHDAYACELIVGYPGRDRSCETIETVIEARRILDLYRGVKA